MVVPSIKPGSALHCQMHGPRKPRNAERHTASSSAGSAQKIGSARLNPAHETGDDLAFRRILPSLVTLEH
ncbi:hypothetical protein ACFFX0_15040 [Citricoccus parietis]|uniref:Uncharacterized protein n=1 Tax=Citricoccus parietis TaxID=592307 RepID=A0ABV5G1C2_9MICC